MTDVVLWLKNWIGESKDRMAFISVNSKFLCVRLEQLHKDKYKLWSIERYVSWLEISAGNGDIVLWQLECAEKELALALANNRDISPAP